jgi:uncharacterized protein (TIGR02466 family)
MYTVYPLFSAPVYTNKLDYLSAENVNYITNLQYKRTLHNDANISLNTYVLNLPELKELKYQVINHINTYLYDVIRTEKNIKFKLLNSWVMQHLPKDYGPPHNHNNSLFSGVLYIKTSENCGNIQFNNKVNNNFSETIRLKYEEYNIYNSSSFYFKPSDGLILLFPSYLSHEILPNLSEDLRYCLSFNIFIEGELGETDGIDILSLK